MFDKCRNSKQQGDMGVGEAISYFIKTGRTVLFPLSDNEPYDLAFDDGFKLNKVQIRTTYSKTKSGNFEVNLRVMGGNQSFQKITHFDRSKVDYLFVLTQDNERYLIPSLEIKNKSSLSLGKTLQKFKV